MKDKGAQIDHPRRGEVPRRLIAPIQDEVASRLKTTDLLQLIRSHAK